MNKSEKKLKTISTLYYILTILKLAASFIPLSVILQDIPQENIWLAILFTSFGILGSLFILTVFALTGYAIRKHKWWTYCFIISIIVCISFPLGTALGIYTIMTLRNPEIKKLFNYNKKDCGD